MTDSYSKVKWFGHIFEAIIAIGLCSIKMGLLLFCSFLLKDIMFESIRKFSASKTEETTKAFNR